MLNEFLKSFIAIFVIMDALGNIPIFYGLNKGFSEQASRAALNEVYSPISNSYSKLIDYIHKELKKGASHKRIKSALLDRGWSISLIDKAFNNEAIGLLLKPKMEELY